MKKFITLTILVSSAQYSNAGYEKYSGDTKIIYAAGINDEEGFKEHLANVTPESINKIRKVENIGEVTALMAAAHNGNSSMVETLLKRGASSGIQNRIHWDALTFALMNGYYEEHTAHTNNREKTVKMLLSHLCQAQWEARKLKSSESK